ncbi:MAG: KEOPS complex subunit Pcc1 [Candidatus Micrarchaeota archaeon]
MKTILEVEFTDAKQAAQAAKIIKETKNDDVNMRAKVNIAVKKEKLIATITANDFTALRAMTTTLMRDLKVVNDGFAVIK